MLWAAKKLHHPIAILDLSDFGDFFSQIFFEAVNESRQLLVTCAARFFTKTATQPRFLSTKSGVLHPGAVAPRVQASASKMTNHFTGSDYFLRAIYHFTVYHFSGSTFSEIVLQNRALSKYSVLQNKLRKSRTTK